MARPRRRSDSEDKRIAVPAIASGHPLTLLLHSIASFLAADQREHGSLRVLAWMIQPPPGTCMGR